jgi:hypothetical protein
VVDGEVPISLPVAAASPLVCADGDVRDIIGLTIFRVPTGHSDEHRTAAVAARIISELQGRLRTPRRSRAISTAGSRMRVQSHDRSIRQCLR